MAKKKKGVSTRTKAPAKKGARKPSKKDEVIAHLSPDIVVTVAGQPSVGKAVVMTVIARALKGAGIGLDVFTQASDTLIDSYVRVKKSKLATKPEWDGRVRKVLLRKSRTRTAPK